ncbi:hypothetical protein [Falsiroseomonas sp. CW058]|uniref:hypothetical protein n=1 Tax=Falsiroseomonas sp. CW058 TaxID=3388664 RepID=UPI003D324459
MVEHRDVITRTSRARPRPKLTDLDRAYIRTRLAEQCEQIAESLDLLGSGSFVVGVEVMREFARTGGPRLVTRVVVDLVDGEAP